jgi:hypothetical protein
MSQAWKSTSATAAALLAGLLALCAASLPSVAAESFFLDNLRLDLGYGIYTIPRLEVEESSVSAAELRDLIETQDHADLPARLARLDARRAVMPEVVLEQSFGPIKQKIVYRDMILSGIAAGRIASITVAGASVSSALPGDVSTAGDLGAIRIAGFDMVALARFFLDEAAAPDAPMLTVYESFEAGGYKLTTKGPQGSHEISVGSMSGHGVKVRPVGFDLSRFMGELMSIASTPKGTPDNTAAVSELLPRMLKLYTAFAFAGAEVQDMRMKADVPGLDLAVARLAVKDMSGTRIGEMALEGIEITPPDGAIKLGRLAIEGFDYTPLINSLSLFLENLQPGQLPATDFKPELMTFSRFAMADIFIDVPQPVPPDQPGAVSPGRSRLSLGGFDVTASKWSGTIPTAVAIKLDRLLVPLDPANPQMALLMVTGLEALDLSARLSSDWDEGSRDLTVEEASVDLSGLGRVKLSAKASGVDRALLGFDEIARQMAMVSAKLHSLDLAVENSGLVELVLGSMGAAQGATAETMQQQVSLLAGAIIPQMLGQAGGAEEVAAAVSTFLARPRSLYVSARSKDGIGMLDSAEPAGAMQKVEFTARANE